MAVAIESVPVARPGWRRRLQRWCRLHRPTFAAAAAVLVLVAALAATAGQPRAAATTPRDQPLTSQQRRDLATAELFAGLELLRRARMHPRWAVPALEFLDRAVAHDAGFAEAQRARAEALALAGRPAPALAAYVRAQDLAHAASGRDDPGLALAIAILAWERLHDLPLAQGWCRRAALADPVHPLGRLAAAILTGVEGRPAEALAAVKRLAAAEPDWWEIQRCLGLMLLGTPPLGPAPEVVADTDPVACEIAHAAFDRALRLAPGDHRLYLDRIAAIERRIRAGDRRGDLVERAITDAEIALTFAPSELAVHVARLQINLRANRRGAVDQELAVLRNDWPREPAALRARAAVEAPAGKMAPLLKELDALIAADPGSRELRRLRAEWLR